MNNQQIGRGGELLVQYKLLLLGIDSSPMKTESGIDLVAYSNRNKKAYTILVKTNESPKQNNGKFTLGWWIPEDCPADLIAFVDLSSNAVWLFSSGEVPRYSQERYRGRLRFSFYVDPVGKSKGGRLSHKSDFNQFILERRAPVFF
jgi:hypothetical protein